MHNALGKTLGRRARPNILAVILGYLLLLIPMTKALSATVNVLAPVNIVEVGVTGALVAPKVANFDVGIVVATDIDVSSGTDLELAFRQTEANLIGARLRQEFESHGSWGPTRLFPAASVIPQVLVDMSVLESDGRDLVINVRVTDVSGALQLHQTYLDTAASEDYLGEQQDPFGDLYRRIHFDVASRFSNAAPGLRYLRLVSFLRYANQLVPTAFPDYLVSDVEGWRVQREPSDLDPMYVRIDKLRTYELLFVDTVDEQLTSIERAVGDAYLLWLRSSKEQLDWLDERRERELMTQEFRDDSTFARLQAVYAAYRSLKIHEQELLELILDLEGESRSTAISVDEQVFKLEGTLTQQYREWRETLTRIVALESDL